MKTHSNSVQFKRGEIIFSEGDSADCAFIIDQGEVEIFIERNETETPLGILGKGEIFGEMAIIDGRRRSASARAFTDCSLTTVSQNQVQERVDHADSIVRLLLMILLKRIRTTNDSIDADAKVDVRKADVTTEFPVDLKLVEPTVVIEKIKFESELLQALQNQNFVMHYQPIVNMKDHSLSGVEALIRWNSPSRGMVRPDLFMGIAEETSLIIPIGRWVMGQALSDLVLLKKHFGDEIPDFSMSINISGRQFQDPAFFNDLEQAALRNRINKEHVKLEVTESVLMDGAFANACIQRMKDMGFKVSLDDFGTGYSSLSYLSELNLDNLKIDRSFVKNLLTDKRSMILCRSITNIASDLGLKIIAEGVETVEQAKALADLGCAYGQGYYFGKPMPLADLVVAFRRKTSA